MKPHICFVALNCYNLIADRGDIAHIGGAEVQQVLMSRWLVEQGYRVSFVTCDHGQEDGIEINGIKIFKAYKKDAGLPFVRFFFPRWQKLAAAMRRANADVYYQRAADVITGQVGLSCWARGRKFVYGVANVGECMKALPYVKSQRERQMYRLGLKLADRVVTQTEYQSQMLKDQFGLESTVVRSCGEPPPDSLTPPAQTSVLWVGRISEEKRFEWLVELARLCPDITFNAVGDENASSSYGQRLKAEAAALPNMVLHGRVAHDEMEVLYRQNRILCSTSPAEGFPNVFLEAWRVGLPVLTVYDPDDVVKRNGCGWTASGVEELGSILQSLDDNQIGSASATASRYYREHHLPARALPVFGQLLTEVHEAVA